MSKKSFGLGKSSLCRATAAACCTLAIAQQQQQCSRMPAAEIFSRRRVPLVVADNIAVFRGGDTSSDDSKNSTANTDNAATKEKPFTRSTMTQENSKQTSTKQGESSKKKHQHQKQESPSPRSSTKKNPKQYVPDDYYELLGVSKTATLKQIQKAYRRKAVQYHPDKTNGDRTMFDHISAAYDVLSDEKKRATYDRFGKRGVENPGGSPFSNAGAADIFSSFFGPGFSSSSGSFRAQQQQMRNRNVRYQLEVTLEDLYKGSTRRVTISKLSSSESKKELEIVIERGMKDGQSIVLSGENDAIPNATPGNIIFLITQARHAVFTRKNNDLAMVVTISLKESLCGKLNDNRTFTHLDGRTVVLQLTDNEDSTHSSIIQNGEFRVLKGEGMPVRGRSGLFGDLYVQFRVQIPSSRSDNKHQQHARLTKGEREMLGNLLDLLTTESTVSSSSFAERKRTMIRNSLLKMSLEYGVKKDELLSLPGDDTSNQSTKLRDRKKKATDFLQPASASDFGKSYQQYDNEQVDQEDEEDEYDRFMRSDPFQQFRFFSPGRSRPFDFNSNAQQCQQM